VGAAAPAVSGMAAVTRKQSRGRRHRDQRIAASSTVEDADRTWRSRRCRVPPGRRVGDGNRETTRWSRQCR
jgi:hypothetical protein